MPATEKAPDVQTGHLGAFYRCVVVHLLSRTVGEGEEAVQDRHSACCEDARDVWKFFTFCGLCRHADQALGQRQLVLPAERHQANSNETGLCRDDPRCARSAWVTRKGRASNDR